MKHLKRIITAGAILLATTQSIASESMVVCEYYTKRLSTEFNKVNSFITIPSMRFQVCSSLRLSMTYNVEATSACPSVMKANLENNLKATKALYKSACEEY